MEFEVPARVAVLVGPRGRGSNMLALIEAAERGEIEASIDVVIAPAEDAPALELARARGLKTATVEYGDRFGNRLCHQLEAIDYLCLAGFMRVLPSDVLDFMKGRVLNIHPSLLPKFGGHGMFGMRVHEAVIEAGESESGCTVHHVTETYDEGPPLLQMRCPVLPCDTPDTLAARVLELEHRAYPLALQKAIHEATA